MDEHDAPTEGSTADHVSVLRRNLAPPTLLAVRIAAVLFVAAALFLYFRWLPHWLDLRLTQAGRATLIYGANLPFAAAIWISAALGMVAMSAWCAMAFLILLGRSRDLLGILLFVGFVSTGVIESTDLILIIDMYERDPWMAPYPMAVMALANTLCVLWVYLFPDGRLVSKLATFCVALWIGWNVLRFFFYLHDAWPLDLRRDVIAVGCCRFR